MMHVLTLLPVRTALVLTLIVAVVHPAVAQPPDAAPPQSAAPGNAAPQVPDAGSSAPAEAGQPPDVDAPPTEIPDDRFGRFRFRLESVFRLGSNYVMTADQEIEEVVVISGNARIAGRVQQDVVVILGSAEVLGTANIEGSLVVIGGRAAVSQGARVGRDLVVIGGGVNAPPGFSPGNEQVIISTTALGIDVEPLVPWVTRGLLWGRPIVPGLDWVWGMVGFVFLVYLALNALLDRPVQACARTLSERPLTSLGVGLLALLLVGPVFLLLAVSVVGIIVIPFALCALLLAWILGKVGVARAIGLTMMADPEQRAGRPSRGRATVAFAIGFAVLVVAYMIPILGLIAWTMVGVIGLGAAALAFVSGYRRENPYANGSAPAPSGAPGGPPGMQLPPLAHAPAGPLPGGPVPKAPLASVLPPAPAADVAGMSHPPVQSTAAEHPAALPDEPPVSGATPPPPPLAPPPIGPPIGPPSGAPPMAAADGSLLSFRRAFFRERLAAFVLDVLLVAIAVTLLGIFGRDGERTIVLLLLLYYIGFWSWKGTTVGGIICQLRVVRTTGAPLQFSDALVRGLTGILSLAALGLGGFWILVDQQRQAWHDKVAGTYVVKVPHGWPV